MSTLDRADRALKSAEWLWMLAASIGMFAVMIIIFVDVAARYLFKAPLPWSFDLISLYLMPAIFFLALADTLTRNHHVNVDILLPRFPPRLNHAFGLATSVLALFVFVGIAYAAWIRTREAIAASEVTSGLIQWPTWMSSALVMAGVALLVLRLTLRITALGVAAVTGREDVPGLPPRRAPDAEL